MMKSCRFLCIAVAVVLTLCLTGSVGAADNQWLEQWRQSNETWTAVHLMCPGNDAARDIEQIIEQALGPMGVNVLILEVDYHFNFKSRPELADPAGLTAENAGRLTRLCRKNGIRLIPLFNCLGHQSWKDKTFALLREHPEFDETPDVPANNEGIYCRQWCPLHPGVNRVVFDLMDELIEAFDADAFHVGMDEVFLLGSEQCRRCKGKHPGLLFTKAAVDYHRHLVEQKNIEMLMWGDRLLNAKIMPYGKWEASETGTHMAADMLPRDIIICDWHYTERDDYPSVPYLLQKGYRVLPATYNDPEAAVSLLESAQKYKNDRMLGMLFTSWGNGNGPRNLLNALRGDTDVPKDTKGVAEAMKKCIPVLTGKPISLSSANPASVTHDPADENDRVCVIPAPAHLEVTGGDFQLKYTARIYYPEGADELRPVAEFLAEHLRPATVLALPVHETGDSGPADGSILLTTSAADKDLGDEGYQLIVTEDSVVARAPEPAGLFYAVQTIRQLLPPEIESERKVLHVDWQIPCVRITDKPRFEWRGSLLDCCRHFMSKNFVKRYIDLLAYHKMNRFHWHLTEDQGWRIEIKKYPKLTQVSAWRGEDNYGGYYTQQDVRDIVEYAKKRFVMVIPEIEMPGHSQAALAAYPELSCTGGPFEVATNWGVMKEVYCAGNDKVFKFLEDVLTEVIGLFPAPYVHIGGDECPKERWKNCAKCQARIEVEGLENEHELQSWFIKRIEKFLLSKNRRLIGWDEILEGGLAPQATVQSWRGTEGGIAAATSGHDAIMSPTSHCYFDYSHKRTPLKQVYSFEPVPEALNEKQTRHILGGEGNMWTEYAPQHLIDYRVYPRLSALAEVLWSPKELRNWQNFTGRMDIHYRRLDILGVNYFEPVTREEIGQWSPDTMSTEWKTLEFDITEVLKKLKPEDHLYVDVQYEKGAHGVNIESVALFKNGAEIDRDRHEGFSGHRQHRTVYTLKLSDFSPDAEYTIGAKMRSDGGTDSAGGVYLSKKEPLPDGV